MKKNVAISIISILAVLAIFLGILYFTNNAGKQKEIDNLTADVSEKTINIETLNAEVADRDGQIKTLNNDVADRDSQIETLKAANADKSKKIETLNADVTDKSKQIDTLKTDVADRDDQIKSLNTDIADRSKQIDALNVDVADRDGQIKTLSADIADKSKQIDALNADVADRDGRIKTLNADVTYKSGQIDALTADIANKIDQIDTLTADNANKINQIDALTADVADRDGQIKSLSVDVADKSKQIDTLNADVADRDGQIKTLSADVANKASQIETLNKDVSDKNEQITVLNEKAVLSDKELESLRIDNEGKDIQIKSLTEEIRTKEKMIVTLTEQNEEKDRIIEELQSPIDPESIPVPIFSQDKSVSGYDEENEKVKDNKEEVVDLKPSALFAEPVQPFTLNKRITLNKENVDMFAELMFRGDKEKIAELNQLIDFLNGLEYTVLCDGVDAEGFISMKGENLASFLALKDENILKIFSDQVPSYCFVIGPDDLAGLIPEIPADKDLTKWSEDLLSPLIKMMAGIKFGEPEAVNETMFETEFTSKTTFDMSTKEMALLGLNAIKEFLENEEVAKILVSLKKWGLVLSTDKINEAIKAVEESREEEMPAVDAAIYANANNDAVIKVEVSKNGELLFNFISGQVGENGMLEVEIGDMWHINVKAGEKGVNVIILFQSTELNIDVVPEKRENGEVITATISLAGMEMVKFEYEMINEATLTGKFSIDGKKEITITDLRMNKELVKEISTAYLTTYKPVLNEKLQKIAPEMLPVIDKLEKLIDNAIKAMPPEMIPGI